MKWEMKKTNLLSEDGKLVVTLPKKAVPVKIDPKSAGAFYGWVYYLVPVEDPLAKLGRDNW